MQHFVGQIRTEETHTDDILFPETEILLDVLRYLRGSCGRKGQNGTAGLYVSYPGYLQVRRTEVITPLADAMCLVNGYEADVHVSQLLEEQFGTKPLGRHIQELIGIEYAVLQNHKGLLVRETGMDTGRFYAPAVQCLYLILHQGYKRGYHQTCSGLGKSGNLEGNTLTATCGHQT